MGLIVLKCLIGCTPLEKMDLFEIIDELRNEAEWPLSLPVCCEDPIVDLLKKAVVKNCENRISSGNVPFGDILFSNGKLCLALINLLT